MTFYDRLSLICDDRGLSVSALCKKIGLNPTTGATWKKRGSVPKSETLKAIAEELDVDTFWFFVEPDDFMFAMQEGVPYRSEEEGLTKAEVIRPTWAKEKSKPTEELDEEFLLLARKLSPAQRQRVMDFMRGILA